MSLLILTPLLASLCYATPVGTRVADVPFSATDSVATFTWTDATETTTATFTLPQRRELPTWPRHFHHPLDIHHLAQPTETLNHAVNDNEYIANPKHQVEYPPIKTGIHHEPASKEEAQPTSKEHLEPASKEEARPTSKEHHEPHPTKTSISLNVPTEIALLHEAAILHERQDVSTFTFTGASTTAIFTFTSPTGTDGFSFPTLTGTDALTLTNLPFQKDRRAATTVTATWEGSTTTFTFDTDATSLPFALDKRVTTAAPKPSAFPVNVPDTCADACDAADVSCSSLLTSYTANTMCSSWFTSCHSFCSATAAATALPALPTL